MNQIDQSNAEGVPAHAAPVAAGKQANVVTPPEPVVRVEALTKVFQIWKSPRGRLWNSLVRSAPRDPGFPADPGMDGERTVRRERHDDFFALRDVSFQMRRGEALGVIGRNGSGKSTLLQLLAGTLRPTSGTVRVRGRVAALLELGSGFNPEFTGRENVFLNAALYGLSHRETRARFESIAAFADIGDFIDQPVKTYSSGMALRLAFAVVAHVDADVLIVDEALAVGDVFFVQKCMRWLTAFRERGTLLFVTHQAADLSALCERAIWLLDGRIADIGEAKVVAQRYLAYFNQQSSGVAGAAHVSGAAARREADARSPTVDRRSLVLACERERTDFRLYEFDPEGEAYGTGLARIVGVRVLDRESRVRTTVDGGEDVCLTITAEALVDLDDIILGWVLKNRLGQYIFGDNTYLTTRGKPVKAPAGSQVEATFRFRMPLLPRGSYVIAPAVASGDLENHVQHHWIHEALLIESTHVYVHRGLVALPMDDIRIAVSPAQPVVSVGSTG